MSLSALETRTLSAVRDMPRGYPLGINSAVCRRLAATGHLRAKEVFNSPRPDQFTLHFFLTAKGRHVLHGVVPDKAMHGEDE